MAGKEGVTVRWGAAAADRVDVDVDEAAGFAEVAEVLVVEGLVVEVVVAGAALEEETQAVRDAVEEMLRCDIRYAEGAARDDADALRSAEKPLRAVVVAIAIVYCVVEMAVPGLILRNASTRSHDFLAWFRHVQSEHPCSRLHRPAKSAELTRLFPPSTLSRVTST